MKDPIERSFGGYTENDLRHMRVAMRFSLGIGFFMLLIKTYAYVVTGSAAILSDAAESIVHVLAVSFAAYSLRLSMKPPDESHMYGHDRISFFSAGFEGAMIVIAALYIMYDAIHKWLVGLSIEDLGQGITFTTLAAVTNGLLGWYLVRQGKKYHSIVLVANGKHVLTDSWTSLGVIMGLILIVVTGWLPFDPILAMLVACNILWTGGKLIRQSIGGLMDESDPAINAKLLTILEQESEKYNLKFHGLRHRNAGNKLLVEFHLLFNENVSVVLAHEQATLIEQEIQKAFPNPTEVLSHLEPLEGHDEIHEKLLRDSKSKPNR
ncbi:MAG: cation transporter [Ignavibacteriales bacterium]|nr:cation transporter [Ignavibacteriales bacterium]